MITSASNPKIKLLASLALPKFRKEHGAFLVEGPRLVLDAVAAGLAREIYYVSSPEADRALAAAKGVPTVEVSDACMKKISDLKNPPPCVAAADIPRYDIKAILGAKLEVRLVVLAGLQDPGNVGTIIRTADAAGFDAAILVGDSADPFSPKAVRSSASSILNIPVIEADGAAVFQVLKAAGVEVVFAEPRGGEPLDRFRFADRTAVVIGSEGAGIAPELYRFRDRGVTIPIRGKAESLNAAAAAAIIMFRAAEGEK